MVFVLRSLSVQIVKEVNIININVIVSIVSEKYWLKWYSCKITAWALLTLFVLFLYVP